MKEFIALCAGAGILIIATIIGAPPWSIILGAGIETITFIIIIGRFVYVASHVIDDLLDDLYDD